MGVLAVHSVSSWSEIVEVFDYLTAYAWVCRGHERVDWPLQTSLEREFPSQAADVEQRILSHFVRTAPRLLPAHLIPHDQDAAAWLGLIQHYGGPTRLLDVTRSPYIALFFAFEPTGSQERVVWAIDEMWCVDEAAKIMAETEGIAKEVAFNRLFFAQMQLVSSLVHRRPWPEERFSTFQPFTGVFPVEIWKPDARQSAQQAKFLCSANLSCSFEDNLAGYRPATNAMHKVILPASLREEALEKLSYMNVNAATLFPDLTGLARSLRTHTLRRAERPDRTFEVQSGPLKAQPS